MVVVIDAGHGAKDGAYDGVQVGGLYEDQLTIAIAQQVKELNTDPNLQIVLTREGEERVDLHQRVDKTVAAGADLFVSIHVNAATDKAPTATGKTSGFEIYTSRKNQTFAPQNIRLASAITQSLKGLTASVPTVAQRQMGMWVLDQAPCPAVLLECGYLTDAADRAFISNKANQKAVAQKLLEGITAYVNAPKTIAEVQAKDVETVDVVSDKITVTYTNGQMDTLTKKEALQNGITINATQDKVILNQRIAETDRSAYRVRGNDSLSKALILVDGKPVAYKDLNNEDPSNIKHINVLRPSDAVAKYGEAGKYGAMEISTKPVEVKEVHGYVLPKKGDDAKPATGEVVVKGYALPKKPSAEKPELKEVTVTGHKSNKPVLEEKPVKEMAVTGYAKKAAEEVQQTFTQVEQEARFPEENGGWQKFLSTTLNAEVPGNNGAPAGTYKVVVRLLIAKDGTIEEILPLTHQGYGTEEEVIRALKLSPKWIPAKQNGKVVRSYHEQPITFIIAE